MSKLADAKAKLEAAVMGKPSSGMALVPVECVMALLAALDAAERERDSLHERLAAQSGYAEDETIAELRKRLARADADKARLDWFDRIWKADDINALDLAWQSSTPGPAGSGRAAIDAAMLAMPTTEMSE